MKQKLLDGYSQMREDIATAKDKHLRKLWIFIRDEMDNLPKDRFLDEVEYRILQSLEETSAITRRFDKSAIVKSAGTLYV